MNALADIRKLLEPASLGLPEPPRVVRIELEEGFDSTGDPALYIWVLLDDETTLHDEVTWQNVKQINRTIRDTLRDADEQRWPYVRFRTESEHRTLIEE
jgi:hypothetical protein